MKYNRLLYFGLIISLFINLQAHAQTPIEDEIFIWPGTAPGSDSVKVEEAIVDRNPNGGECYLNRAVSKVTRPSIKHFAPAHPNGKAVMLCPGGGYALLAYDKEGYDIAQWFNERDITAFVLKYRLPIDGHLNRQYVPLQDAQRALRYIRANAETFNIDTNSIGVMGGSAGGHLAASLSVFYDWKVYNAVDSIDSVSARPDYTFLMYPVISFQDSLVHEGTRSYLLGNDFTKAQIDSFSTDLHVDSLTPPAYLFHSKADGSVKYKNSVAYANALENAGVINSLNLYASGGHGIGMCEAGTSDFSRWPRDLDAWLVEQGLTTPCQGETPEITVDETDSVVLIASPASGYQWYKSGILIKDAMDSIFVPEVSGAYSVSVFGEREESGSQCLIYSEEAIVEIIIDNLNAVEIPVSIYPNPASSQITVNLENITGQNINYRIINQLGASVVQRDNIPFNTTLNIDISGLSKGLYYLSITSDSKVLNGRFLKE